jgi:pimeloyl-ACP methyl ester carboxylesterase
LRVATAAGSFDALDAYIGETAARDVERHVEGLYRFEIIAGASHWISEEAPERLSALVLEHLDAW